MKSKLELALFLFAIFSESCVCVFSQTPITQGDECKWRKNFTEVNIEDISHHHYKVLEDCLYYYLSDQAEQKHTSLSFSIPPYTRYLPIRIQKATVKSVITSRIRTRTTVDGKFQVSWIDRRMTYDVKKWKIPSLKIKSQYHIWVPDFKILEDEEGGESIYSGFDFLEHIQVSPSGLVTADLPYNAFAVCKEDFSRYPDDHKICCFRVQSEIFTDVIKFDLAPDAGTVTPEAVLLVWHVRKIEMALEQSFLGADVHTMKVCVTIERASKTLRMELTLPLVITAILVILAPFFGSFKNQLYVKVFTLLLQFLCFQFLSNRTPREGFGEHIPKIYKFYEFSIVMTLISLVSSVILYALSRVDRKIPPPYRFSLISAAANTWLFCSDVPEVRGPTMTYAPSSGSAENQAGDAPPPAVSAGTYTKEWVHVFVAINNVFSLLVLVIYILGILILCT